MSQRNMQKAVRQVLLANPDGLHALEILEALEIPATYGTNNVNRICRSMADVYIDRWHHHASGRPAPVWMAVKVPEDCPRPTLADSRRARAARARRAAAAKERA